MANDRNRERQLKEQSAGDEHRHGAHGENQILFDDRCGPACQLMRIGKPSHVFRQQRDVGSLKRDVRTDRDNT